MRRRQRFFISAKVVYTFWDLNFVQFAPGFHGTKRIIPIFGLVRNQGQNYLPKSESCKVSGDIGR
jgi:hypothetical protein